MATFTLQDAQNALSSELKAEEARLKGLNAKLPLYKKIALKIVEDCSKLIDMSECNVFKSQKIEISEGITKAESLKDLQSFQYNIGSKYETTVPVVCQDAFNLMYYDAGISSSIANSLIFGKTHESKVRDYYYELKGSFSGEDGQTLEF